jgi:hypothetical protein
LAFDLGAKFASHPASLSATLLGEIGAKSQKGGKLKKNKELE